MSAQFITPKKRPHSPLDSNELLPSFEDPQDMINAVVSTLLAPEEKTNVSIAYANEKNQATEIQAYAKIAGKDWTFYVKSLAVSIGRNIELSAPSNTNITTPLIDIDLGPAKVVSRLHAAITYNLDLRCWELKVLGRNGARIDGQKVNVDSPNVNALHSGAILDIGGTQMMFILPDAPAVVAPKMLEKCLLRYKEQQQQQNKRISSGPGIGGSTSFQMFDKAHLTHSPSSISANSLQSNLDQDLSKEEAKDIKPPYSYATMITQAILSNPQGVMSLSEIYNWIADHYAYYKYSKTGWQNSIRHNLSLNKAFEKVPRRPNEPGKGMKWQISESYKEEFLNKISDGTILKTRRGSSVSRQLSLHLATHNQLPESHKYTMDQQIHNGTAASIPQQQKQQQQQQQKRPPQQQNSQPHLSQPHYTIPSNPMQTNSMGYIPQSNIYNMSNSDRRYTPYQQLQNPLMYQHQQQHIGQTYNQLGRPQGQLGQPMMQPQQQSYTLSNIKTEPSSPKRNPSISNNTPKMAKGTVSTESHSRSTSYTTTQLHEMSNFNSSANDSTSTAPTASTTTNGDIGLNFASPKKITALEAYTPERGSKGNHSGTNNNNNNNTNNTNTNTTNNNNGKNTAGGPNTNQSSPAFWNFVQFSTPNGQSPVRKSSEEVGNNSPTLNRKIKRERENDETNSPFKKKQRTEMIDL